ncbi:MAG: 3-methyl-2-oxobutanoate hydroxymethyltransferase [Chitinispirillales bacterium]|jgi:3-methyl-2-oxobutanoate hydroxymethyltransferase|nr:3-methyl-2-oxobutanoate hydroxymethyltransferase [Chitinispirillales bacterium]
MKKDLKYITEKKLADFPITMITAYDFPSGQAMDEAGIDCVLVGDSVGTNYLGLSNEREVTIADMLHHTSAVRRGVRNAFLIADLPFGCADTVESALANSRFLIEKGADCVKIEGWSEKAEIVNNLVNNGCVVCAHIGYNPQIHNKPAVFGKDKDQAEDLLNSASVLAEAGASLIVLEKVPAELAEKISNNLKIPTIGIGSGNGCDGQVLVINDLLGLSPKLFKHVRRFANLRQTMLEAFKEYKRAVENREFPA